MRQLARLLKPLAFTIALFAAVAVGQTEARADSVTFMVGSLLTGSNTVTGNVTVTVTDIGSTGNVRVTVVNNTNGDLTNLALNYSSAITGGGAVSNLAGAGPAPVSVVFGNNSINAPTGARFDVGIAFPTGQPAGRLNPGESITFDLDASSPIFATGFNTLTAGGQRNFFILAHIQSINGGGQSAKLVGEPNAPIPEPAAMLLLGTGLAGAAASIRQRRKGASHPDSQL